MPKGNQANTAGADSSKFGMKFDSGKTRFDLVDMESFKQMVISINKSENRFKSGQESDINKVNSSIQASYIDLLMTAEYDDVGELVANDAVVDVASNIAYWAAQHLTSPGILGLLRQVADTYTYGSKLYGDYNWKLVDPRRYISALGRHIDDLVNEQRYDSESGLHHSAHIIWNCLTIIYKNNHNG